MRSDSEQWLFKQAAPVGIFACNSAGRISGSNPRWRELSGLQDASSANWLEVVHPEERPEVEKLWKLSLEHRESFACACRLQSSSAEVHFVFAQANLNKPESDILVYITDLSAVPVNEHCLMFCGTENVNALMDRMAHFNLSSDLLCITDFEGRFKNLNRTWTSTLGYSEADLLGHKLFEFVHPEDLGLLENTSQRLVKGERVLSFETRFAAKQGGYRWLLWRATPDLVRQIVYGAASDITHWKTSSALSDQALNGAHKTHKFESELISLISHEIRTPLNGIIGMTQLLMADPLTGQQLEFLSTLKDSAYALLTIVNDLLDYSLIEAGNFQFEVVDFNLTQSIAGTLRIMDVQARKKKLEIISLVSEDLPNPLIGDPRRIKQILINLMGNAIKFTPDKGGILFEAFPEASLGDNRIKVHFCVTDSGIGIPLEKQKEIFEPFRQADPTITRMYGGSGLGLSITKRLVEGMGGSIWVESQPQVGSSFHFTLPMQHAMTTKRPPFEGKRVLNKGLHVLTVEDNHVLLGHIQSILAKWQLRSVGALDGDAALQALERARAAGDPYNLMIIDASLPCMAGLELAKTVRELYGNTVGILVLLTQQNSREDLQSCRELGVNATLLKPLSHSALLDCIMVVSESLTSNSDAFYPHGQIEEQKSQSEHVEVEQERPLIPLRVLVVEDNIVNQKLLKHLLEKWGHSLVIARNGLEALNHIEKEKFDLVLMDIEMPEMDGIEAAKQIRARERAQGLDHLTIFALTAHVFPEAREQVRQANMDAYIEKPLDAEALRRTLQDHAISLLNLRNKQ